MSSPFFYRFDGLDLIPGNKTAGFAMLLDSVAFVRLGELKCSEEQQARVNEEARARVLRAQLISKRYVEACGIVFFEDTACPRYFVSDAAFGASLGCDPENFGRMQHPEALSWLRTYVEYTPHNTDSPKQALALLVLAQTWAEWAGVKLSAALR